MNTVENLPAHSVARPEATSGVVQKATYVSGTVNFSLSLLLIILGLWAGSQALIADGLHTLSDILADLVVLLALKLSNKSPDFDHQYGHKRYENVFTLVLGLLLIVVSLAIGAAGLTKVLAQSTAVAPHPLALVGAVLALAVKESLFHYLRRLARRHQSSLLLANAWHARTDAASSLIVAVGISGSVLGWPLLDSISALAIALFIGYIGGKISLDAIQDLSDRAVAPDVCAEIQNIVCAVPQVLALNQLRTRKSGDLIWVDLDIAVNGDLTVHTGHAIAHEVIHALHQRLPILDVNVHVEPIHKPLEVSTPLNV